MTVFFIVVDKQQKLILRKKMKQKQREESQTKKIIRYFISQLPDSAKRVFYMDKYYGGIHIMEYLAEQGHGAVLACQGCRPSNLFSGYLGKRTLITLIYLIYIEFNKKHDKTWNWMYKEDGSMLAIAFNDKKVCYFLCNVWNHLGYIR